MRDSRIGRCVRAAAVLAVIASVAPAAWAEKTPDEAAAADRGVIKPPAGEDRGLRKPPPANGSTITVIPPPGTAGNQPNVVPK